MDSEVGFTQIHTLHIDFTPKLHIPLEEGGYKSFVPASFFPTSPTKGKMPPQPFGAPWFMNSPYGQMSLTPVPIPSTSLPTSSSDERELLVAEILASFSRSIPPSASSFCDECSSPDRSPQYLCDDSLSSGLSTPQSSISSDERVHEGEQLPSISEHESRKKNYLALKRGRNSKHKRNLNACSHHRKKHQRCPQGCKLRAKEILEQEPDSPSDSL